MKKQYYFLPFRTWLYGVFALYLFGVVLYWESGFALPTTQKKEKNTACCQIKKTPKTQKKKCCSGNACPTTPQEKSKDTNCPSSCPCNVPASPYPSHLILSNDNIVAYQSKKQEIKKNVDNLFPKGLYTYHIFSTSVALPTDVLPTDGGKERLKRFAIWRV
jgi:hypothetical protein